MLHGSIMNLRIICWTFIGFLVIALAGMNFDARGMFDGWAFPAGSVLAALGVVPALILTFISSACCHIGDVDDPSAVRRAFYCGYVCRGKRERLCTVLFVMIIVLVSSGMCIESAASADMAPMSGEFCCIVGALLIPAVSVICIVWARRVGLFLDDLFRIITGCSHRGDGSVKGGNREEASRCPASPSSRTPRT